MEAVSDEALFRAKLKHMGKCECPRPLERPRPPDRTVVLPEASPDVFSPSATRKKLFEIARAFSDKTKRRRSRRRVLLKHHSYPGAPGVLALALLCSLSSLTALASRLGTADSTANLLDDVEGNAGGEASPVSCSGPAGPTHSVFVCAEDDGQPRRASALGAKEAAGEPVSW